ncbi:MAG: DASS family sodium-coupled anion symporter [Rhodospirillales bacterium]|nr:DASS family sodium-coupled anion symporter [Rhodospirillales bacterium]
MSDTPTRQPSTFPRHRLIGLLSGPLLAAAMLLSPAPEGLSQQGWWIAGVGVLMAVWWMTEAVPLAVTALAPLILFPILGIRDIAATTPGYAHPLVFLFLGGFLLARAIQVWGLDRRLALRVLDLVGARPRHVIAGIMGVTAFLSMWVSNTATAMVMLPIGQSIIATFAAKNAAKSPVMSPGRADDIGPPLMLGIAYAATIGGMGTIIGTPPNAIFAAYMAGSHGIEISFVRWMFIGVPLVLVLLPLAWLVLTRLAFHVPAGHGVDETEIVADGISKLGTMSRAERLVAAVMLLVAFCWVFRPLLLTVLPNLKISDTGIALMGAMLLFILPVDLKAGRFLLSWKEAAQIRWDVLILFGGGLTLAAAIGDSDLAGWIGAQLIGLRTLPLILFLLIVGTFLVLLSELASNTATAAIFVPIAGAAAVAMGEPVYALALPVALFATLGFMLPVGTPPNAVIFGSGAVEMRHMIRAGSILDIMGIVAVTVTIMSLGTWVFGPG